MAKRRGVTQYLDIMASVYATFYDIAPDMLIVLDDNGLIERVNPAFEKATGYAEQDVIGSIITRVIIFDDKDLPLRLLHKDSGEIKCRVVASRFRGGKVYLVLRPINAIHD